MRSSFTISFDLELYWGIRDVLPLSQARAHLVRTRATIPQILSLLDGYGVNATWATVGFLLAETKQELLEFIPESLPRYFEKLLDPYHDIEHLGENEEEDPCHFGASLVDAIRRTDGQEISSHTFSHYFCLEKGQTSHTFECDLSANCRLAERRGLRLRTIAFPRNQHNPNYDRILSSHGLTAYRSSSHGLLSYQLGSIEPFYKRATRVLSESLPLIGSRTSVSDIGLVEFSSNRFLRLPSSGKASHILSAAMMPHVLAEMSIAAIKGYRYHLWCHPHNFGRSPQSSLSTFRFILDHWRTLNQCYGMRSLSMFQVSSEVLGS